MDNIENLRKKIDEIDKKLLALLAKRKENIQKIAKVKGTTKKIKDQQREQEIIAKCETEFQKNIFKKILQESKKLQKDILT